jgi:hypothetical protein
LKSERSEHLKPIFLFADSQLLFWHDQGEAFLNRVRQALDDVPEERCKAAYVGASNGDQAEFYDIFLATMSGINIHDCRMIPSQPSPDDYGYLDEADLILLAGGDVERGWGVFKENGLSERIIERYYDGALLMGVSAGAIQLGLKGWREPMAAREDIIDTFRLIPFVIDAHDEPEWHRLSQIVLTMGGHNRGFGIPAGGGVIFYPDWSVEPVRCPLVEFAAYDDGLKQTLLFPPDPAAPDIKDS